MPLTPLPSRSLSLNSCRPDLEEASSSAASALSGAASLPPAPLLGVGVQSAPAPWAYTVSIYDVPNRLIAGSFLFPPGVHVAHVLAEWGALLALTSDGKVCSLHSARVFSLSLSFFLSFFLPDFLLFSLISVQDTQRIYSYRILVILVLFIY